MFIKSIRFKIIFWYMLLLSLTLSLFSILLYQNFRQQTYKDRDNLLQSRAKGIKDSIDTYWELEKLEAIKDNVEIKNFEKINNINFEKIAQRWINEEIDNPTLLNIIVQIFDANGKNIASSKNTQNLMILSQKTFNFALKLKTNFENVNVELSPEILTPFRTFVMPVVDNNKLAYIVQVATPLTSIHSSLKSLKLILFLFLPLTVFLTGIAGALLAKITLNPVDKMIDTIHQITAENLKLRINFPDTKDEIKKLADTFNDMLSRLDNAFSSQRHFIEDLSHELKTPLSILKGTFEVTLKKNRSIRNYKTTLRSSLEEIDRIVKTVENLLLFFRFETKTIVSEIKSIDLTILIYSILNNIKILAEQKNIAINFSRLKKIVINGDENQLKRVFLNLIDNSIKYTPHNGKITIKTYKLENFAKIEIIDTGAGISEQDLPHIFDRFYRGNISHTGFGLGLNIVKSIITAHNGEINVKSKPNKNTTFTIFLPLQ